MTQAKSLLTYIDRAEQQRFIYCNFKWTRLDKGTCRRGDGGQGPAPEVVLCKQDDSFVLGDTLHIITPPPVRPA